MRPAPESHQQHQIYLPTSGHDHQACAKPVTGSHFWSTNLLSVEPSGSTICRARGPTATCGYLYRRQRQRRHRHGSHRGSICRQVIAEKFAEAGLLVSSKMEPMAWPDPVWSSLILYAACQVMACLMPGLAWSGLTWPDPVWSSLVQSDPAWCLACPIANWQGAATASGYGIASRCDGVNVNVVGAWLLRRVGVCGAVWVCICVVVCWFVGPYGCGICGRWWIGFVWQYGRGICGRGRWWIGLWWQCGRGRFVERCRCGLVCGGWIGAEMCGSRSLVSSSSKSVLCMVGA